MSAPCKEKSMKIHMTIYVLLMSRLVTLRCLGGVTEYTDSALWQSAVGSFTTITFAEFGDFGVVTDEYADLGIIFPDGNDGIDTTPNAYNDNFGLGSVPPFGPIHFVFDTPQLWIAVDFPGGVTLDLYSMGGLMYSSGNIFQGTGVGNVGGLLSDQFFDEVIIHDFGQSVFIDNLYFGVPSPSAMPLLALVGILGRRRRRRRKAN
jgi:MYXO-CTERM domain-containing protein